LQHSTIRSDELPDGASKWRTWFVYLLLGAILPLLAACGRFEDQFTVKSGAGKVVVSSDGSALVSETFDVLVKHAFNYGGVYVDVPQRFTDPRGVAHWRMFQLLSTKRDGLAEHRLNTDSVGGHSTYIGKPYCKSCNSSLPLGPTEIEISYHLSRLIREDTGRQILILPAYMASVHGRAAKKTVTFTIPAGGTLRSVPVGYEITMAAANELVLTIKPGDGDRALPDIEIEYAAGTFPAATARDLMRWWFVDHVLIMASLLGPLITLLFVGAKLRRYLIGKAPQPEDGDTISETMSPALAAYLHHDWDDDKARKPGFMASACRLAIERKFRISGLDDDAEVSDNPATGNPTASDAARASPWNSLAVVLRQIRYLRPFGNRSRIANVLPGVGRLLRTAVIEEYRRKAREYGATYGYAVFFLLILCFIVAYLSGVLTVVLAACLLLIAILAPTLKYLYREQFPADGEDTFKAILVSLLFLAFALYGISNSPATSEQVPYLLAIGLNAVGIVLVAVVWRIALRKQQPMREGLLILRRYLQGETTGPAMSIELYERYLPYAIALGVEQGWTVSFDSWRQGAGVAAYAPDWLNKPKT
jgi:hypothetical protein